MQGTGKTKWRSMEEIKQEMKDIDLKVTEDYLSMKELLKGLEQEKEEENQVTVPTIFQSNPRLLGSSP